MFISAPYKSREEFILINLDNVTMAQPRFARGGVGEAKGKTYTSFLLTSYLGSSPTLDTLLEWSTFVDLVKPYDSAWVQNGT